MRYLRCSRRGLTAVVLVAPSCFLLAGCGPKVRPKRPLEAAPIVYCHDAVGHIPGHRPWILGGNCCCTPTEERFACYRAEGTVPVDMTYEQFLDLFAAKGIVTDLDIEYRASNCRDKDVGPHVVFGGRCMATPTPGTRVFEEVTAGKRFDRK